MPRMTIRAVVAAERWVRRTDTLMEDCGLQSGSDEDVAWMRIGVIHAVDEDHLAVRGQNASGENTAIDAACFELREVRDLGAVDELCREHPAR